MTFNAWFSSLSGPLKLLFAAGIVIGSFAAASAFATAGLRLWKLAAKARTRRKPDGDVKKKGIYKRGGDGHDETRPL
jgi:hypothetical protein